MDVPVGYYTQVVGTGRSPTDVVFYGERGVHAQEGCGDHNIGALNSFWRSVENFHSRSTKKWRTGTGMMWAVSQAAPARNIKVDNDLVLFQYWPASCCEAGYASGGWASGLEVGGNVVFGSQQQWMTRNSAGKFDKSLCAWNCVFSGVENAPNPHCGATHRNKPTVVRPTTPLIAEKPYVASQTGSSWSLIVPKAKTDAVGTSWHDGAEVIDFRRVFVARPGDSVVKINAKLAGGLHVIISPGEYELEDSIRLMQPGQVLLGLGIPVLIAPPNGSPCVQVGDVAGVRVAGLLLQAGPYKTSSLLEVGRSGSYLGSESDPTVISDVFARVGGPQLSGMGPVTAMFLIQSQWVVVDNTWLWRADHGPGGAKVAHLANPVDHGIVVMPNAEHVFAYGLASEHTMKDNVLWKANHGTVIFMQAEILYDATAGAWPYSCYTLPSGVTSHDAFAVGCYSYFRDHDAWCENGISVPDTRMVQGGFSVFLNGHGSINHVMNGMGETCSRSRGKGKPCYLCNDVTDMKSTRGQSFSNESLVSMIV